MVLLIVAFIIRSDFQNIIGNCGIYAGDMDGKTKLSSKTTYEL